MRIQYTLRMQTEQLSKEFQGAVLEEYGKEMSLEEAEVLLRDLVEYYALLGRLMGETPKETVV